MVAEGLTASQADFMNRYVDRQKAITRSNAEAGVETNVVVSKDLVKLQMIRELVQQQAETSPEHEKLLDMLDTFISVETSMEIVAGSLDAKERREEIQYIMQALRQYVNRSFDEDSLPLKIKIDFPSDKTNINDLTEANQEMVDKLIAERRAYVSGKKAKGEEVHIPFPDFFLATDHMHGEMTMGLGRDIGDNSNTWNYNQERAKILSKLQLVS